MFSLISDFREKFFRKKTGRVNSIEDQKNNYKFSLLNLKTFFLRIGVLPFLLLISVFIFSTVSDNFLSGRNIFNVLRQSSYLMLVAMGQMFPLLTGGFDLSVGTIVALLI